MKDVGVVFYNDNAYFGHFLLPVRKVTIKPSSHVEMMIFMLQYCYVFVHTKRDLLLGNGIPNFFAFPLAGGYLTWNVPNKSLESSPPRRRGSRKTLTNLGSSGCGNDDKNTLKAFLVKLFEHIAKTEIPNIHGGLL